MGYRKHRFIGYDRDVWLPDDITVEIAIVPASVRNVRSNTITAPQTTVTWHETANFNRGANADMHRRWLHGGAGGAYVGFNFVVDDHKIIQLTPLNEVTWAAGTPAGNATSWHVEQCVNADADLVRARRNTAALMAGLCAAKGWDIGKVVQHNVWYGKNCPLVIRRDGLWPAVVKMVDSLIVEAKRAARSTTPVVPKAEYPPADPIPQLAKAPAQVLLPNGALLVKVTAEVEAVRDTPRLRWATRAAEQIGPVIPKGSRFAVDYLIINPSGSLYWYTPWATRIAHEDTRIVQAEPAAA